MAAIILKKSLFISILLLTTVLKAQMVKQFSLSATNEAISFPFTGLAPIHPGMELGFVFHKNERVYSERKIHCYIGGYYHKKIEDAIYAKLEYEYIVKVKNYVGIGLPIGVGYMHTFYPGELHEQDQSTGDFKTAKRVGQPHAMLYGGIGIILLCHNTFQPFIQQELIITTPFINNIPLIPHSLFKIGLTINMQ